MVNPAAVRVASRWLLRQGSPVHKQEITIQTNAGPETVPAEVIGNWAAHKAIKSSGWAITHIPTGLKVMEAKALKQALGVLAAISENPTLLRADTKSDLLQFRDFLLQLKKQVETGTGAIKLPIDAILLEEGLQNQGRRYGKAGDFWGEAGSSRVIGVGAREIMRNVFLVGIYRPDQIKNPDTRWTAVDSELKSKITEETLRGWAKWAKQGISTKELREKARQVYVEGKMTSVTGEMFHK